MEKQFKLLVKIHPKMHFKQLKKNFENDFIIFAFIKLHNLVIMNESGVYDYVLNSHIIKNNFINQKFMNINC